MERTRYIRGLVRDILTETKITSPPIPVVEIAEKLGLEVRYQRSEDSSWSGMLYRVGTVGIIAVNQDHALTRRRFTIAHELGHYFLSDRGATVFVDAAVTRFRSDRSALGVDVEEIQANRFAAELLMPYDYIVKDVDEASDLEWAIPTLARKYDVSEQAMTLRLVNLGILQP